LFRLTANLSAEALQPQERMDDIFKVLKKKIAHQKYYTQQSYPSEMKDIF
jgi:hypothetical protein